MRSKIASDWKPKMAYVDIRHRFPLLDPEGTHLAFVAYHLEKDDTSANWDATFYGWCDYRQRQAAQLQSNERVTDSMGFPIGVGKTMIVPSGPGDYGQRFLAAFIKHKEDGLSFEDARLAAERDLQEMTDGN